jgi:aspartyl-tRNA(Asn)/glutamyl-tRNA(Gln) amidotransferase subunit B
LYLSDSMLKKIESTSLTIPFDHIKKMKSEYWFNKEFINTLIWDYSTLEFFNSLLSKGFDPKLIAKWIAGQISAYMTAHFVWIDWLPVDEDQLIEFFEIAKEGKIIDNQLKLVMEEMLSSWASASDIIKERWFDAPAFSQDDLLKVCKEVISENPNIVEQYKWWKTSTIGFFVGQVMKKTQGKANPKEITAVLTGELNS